MRARFLIAMLLGATMLVIAAPPAGADDRPAGSGGAYVGPHGDPTAVAGDGGSAAVSGGGAAGRDPCGWQVIVADDVKFMVYPVDGGGRGASTSDGRAVARLHSATGRWLVRWCPGTGTALVGGQALIPEGGLVDPRQLAADALASVSIRPPAIGTSPSANGRLYVQLPTWLWLERSWWQPYEATARAGRVWSTVRAVPVVTTWSLGDGQSVSCRGPGTEWRPGLSEDASHCTHIYRTSSMGAPGGRFEVDATVTFEVSWSSNVTAGGTLPAITRRSSVAVVVGEIQAIGTRGGR